MYESEQEAKNGTMKETGERAADAEQQSSEKMKGRAKE